MQPTLNQADIRLITDALEPRFAAIDQKFEDLTELMIRNFDRVYEVMDEQFDKATEGVNARFDGLERRIDDLAMTRVKYTDHDKLVKRVDVVESKLKIKTKTK